MNIVLWVLQAGLAFMYVSGGAYKVFKTQTLAGHFRGFPQIAWRALGTIEVVGGILLIVPAKLSGVPVLTAAAAALLAIETLTLAAAYASKSVKLVAANPFTWCAPMGILAAVVAWGRFA
ncbi:MAG TPA: DoxX family protein [Gemmatimonadaceae bacterium]